MKNGVKEERRKYTRVPVKLLPLVNISPNQDPKILFQGNIVEISEGGALIQLSNLDIAHYFPTLKEVSKNSSPTLRGNFLWVYFSLPHQKSRIKISAEIIRVQDSYQLALQFLNLPDSDRKQIREFVSKK
jgi:c-di-GMP-binding flagellar brake protein YcgR